MFPAFLLRFITAFGSNPKLLLFMFLNQPICENGLGGSRWKHAFSNLRPIAAVSFENGRILLQRNPTGWNLTGISFRRLVIRLFFAGHYFFFALIHVIHHYDPSFCLQIVKIYEFMKSNSKGYSLFFQCIVRGYWCFRPYENTANGYLVLYLSQIIMPKNYKNVSSRINSYFLPSTPEKTEKAGVQVFKTIYPCCLTPPGVWFTRQSLYPFRYISAYISKYHRYHIRKKYLRTYNTQKKKKKKKKKRVAGYRDGGEYRP
ncbi:hypothetical protein AA313_de0208830 [Arthrobotrys entomopaga]|nr:hypothetical protein AA313_de0208830 [Arthrobotrys entomopaga]